MTETDEPQPLTDEQQAVAEAPVEARQVVTAGAGSGKTHVLAARLSFLVDRQGLGAGDEVLVLSFSRAAVGELRRRVSQLDADAGFVSASTFDSFATALLVHDRPGLALDRMGYKQRIKAATDLLNDPDASVDTVSRCRHVLVDEVQDLVAPRVDLVLALLRRLEVGFTLFGDPAQAIYDFGNEEEEASVSLYEAIGADPGLAHDRPTLTKNFRAQSEEARRVLGFGPRLRDSAAPADEIQSDLRGLVLGLPGLGDLGVPRPLTRGQGRTKAVLCRTNGEALLISHRLHDLGVDHRLQRPAASRAAPGWIAELAHHVGGSRVTRRQAAKAAEELWPDAAEETNFERWRHLHRLDQGGRDEIDLRRVGDRIRTQSLPEELNQTSDDDVVVSTVHRAKGLEFDTVVVVPRRERDDEDLAIENRVLYAALTRARSDLYVADRPDMGGVFPDKALQRWVRRGTGSNHWQTVAIEISADDTHVAEPAGAYLVDGNVVELQRHLRSGVRQGDPVTLELIEGPGTEGVRYAILHDGRPIGVTSDSFARLAGRLGKPARRIEQLRVETVDTVAGEEATSRKHGLGSAGLWNRVRLQGLGELRFDDHAGHAKV